MIREPLRATYGCKNNSHDLLSWNGDIPPPRELLGLTDKPGGHVTPKEKWWPAINCGSVGDWWALWCIEPDFDAPRSGMVKSVVLLWDLNSIPQLDDLQHYIFQLVNQEDCKIPSSKLLMSIANELVCNNDVLATEANESLPLVIAHLWENLWGEARKEFAIRVAFTPPQAFGQAKQPTFYCVPASVLNQWYLPSVTLIQPSERTNISRAANYLLNKLDCDPTLQQMLLNCDELTGDLKILNKLGRAADNIDQYRDDPMLANAITALRTVIVCSTSPDKAVPIKIELLGSIKKLMVDRANATDILTMSNLSSDAVFVGGMPEAELSDWIARHLTDLSEEHLSKYFDRAQPGRSMQWWSKAVVNGIGALVNNPKTSRNILLWLSMDNFQSIFLRLPFVRNDLEQSLFESAIFSDFSVQNLIKLEQFSISQNWAKLNAWTVFHLYDEELVYNKQRNSVPNWIEGVPFLVQSLSHKYVVNLLGEKSFEPFIDLLAERTVREPDILNYIDVAERSALELWQKQLDARGQFYPPNIEKEKFQEKLCSCLQSGLLPDVFEQIAEEVSECLLSMRDRNKVWSRLSSRECKILAENMSQKILTNPALLQHLSDSETNLIEEIKASMNSEAYLEPAYILSYLSQSINHREEDVLRWIKKINSKNVNLHAHSLGRILLEKSWAKVANSLFQSSYGLLAKTPYFKPTVDVCSQLLDRSNKLWFSLYSGPLTLSQRDIVIEQFAEVGANIAYDRLEYLWLKAGGRPSRLRSYGTEFDKWFHAASEADKGALSGGLISLLDVLIFEYPHNEKLRDIYYILSNRYL